MGYKESIKEFKEIPIWLHLIGIAIIIMFEIVINLLGSLHITLGLIAFFGGIYGGYQGYSIAKTKNKNPYVYYILMELLFLFLGLIIFGLKKV